MRWPFLVVAMVGSGLAADPAAADVAPSFTLAATDWQIVKRESGPTNYYTVMSDAEPARSFVRASYRPPMKTAVLGHQVAESDRSRITRVKWSWRAITLPNGGDECTSGKGDSAAVVYVMWKRGLRYYTLKYVWSAVGQKGKICDSKRNLFVAQDTIIVDSGGPLATWRTVDIDLAHEFRAHFEGGDPKAEVPDFVGLGLMSDGDQTSSPSSADYADVTLTR